MDENQNENLNQTENLNKNQSGKQKAKKSIKSIIPIIVAILVIVILLVSGLLFIIGHGNSSGKNLSLIFDENKLVPVEVDGLYGYVSPKNGKMVIKPAFKTANSFYGDFASVSYTENDSIKYGIINKSGKIKLSTTASYNIKTLSEYGLFIVDGVLYNKNLKAITDKNTVVNYGNLGYCYYIKSDNNGKAIEGGIINPKGKVVYTYKFKNNDSYFSCSIGDTNEALDEIYAVTNVNNEKYAIVNLKNGKVVYNYSEDSIYAEDDNIFTISKKGENDKKICLFKNKIAYETSDKIDISYYDYSKQILELYNSSADYSNRYSYYDLNKKSILSEKPEKADDNSLASLTGYVSYSSNRKYGIMKNDKVVLPCEYDNIEFLAITTFNYLKEKKHVELVLAEKNNEYYLINLKNNKVLTSFNTRSVTTYSSSTFIKGKLRDTNETFVYNLATKKAMTFDKDSTVSVYSNYIIVSKNGNSTYYNTNLKEFYKI